MSLAGHWSSDMVVSHGNEEVAGVVTCVSGSLCDEAPAMIKSRTLDASHEGVKCGPDVLSKWSGSDHADSHSTY